jgi:hypothetical protein
MGRSRITSKTIDAAAPPPGNAIEIPNGPEKTKLWGRFHTALKSAPLSVQTMVSQVNLKGTGKRQAMNTLLKKWLLGCQQVESGTADDVWRDAMLTTNVASEAETTAGETGTWVFPARLKVLLGGEAGFQEAVSMGYYEERKVMTQSGKSAVQYKYVEDIESHMSKKRAKQTVSSTCKFNTEEAWLPCLDVVLAPLPMWSLVVPRRLPTSS